MRTAVGHAGHHAVVELRYRHGRAPLFGLPAPTELGLEVFGKREIEHGVGRGHAQLLRDRRDRAAVVAAVLRCLDVIDDDRVPQRRWRRRAFGRITVVVLDRRTQLRARLVVAQQCGTIVVGQLQHAIPRRHRQEVEVARRHSHGAIRRARDEHRIHRRAVGRGTIEELDGPLPRGRGRVDLVAAAEALDDDREAAGLADANEQIFVVLVETADRAERQVADSARPRFARGRAQRQQLVVRRHTRRHRSIVAIEMRRGMGRRQPRGTAPHRLAHDLGHLRDFAIGGGALGGGVAHDPSPHIGMPHVAREVDAELALARPHVFGERFEVPADRAHRGRMHLLDFREQTRHEVAIARRGGRDGKTAIAGEDRGHTVKRRHRRQRFEGHLRVVVRVHVDDARCDDQPVGVEYLGGI